MNSTRGHLILVLAASQLCQFFILVKKTNWQHFHDSKIRIIRTRLTLKSFFLFLSTRHYFEWGHLQEQYHASVQPRPLTIRLRQTSLSYLIFRIEFHSRI